MPRGSAGRGTWLFHWDSGLPNTSCPAALYKLNDRLRVKRLGENKKECPLKCMGFS